MFRHNLLVIYLALYLSRFNPVAVLKGNFELCSGRFLLLNTRWTAEQK